jgi:hypothetical protein
MINGKSNVPFMILYLICMYPDREVYQYMVLNRVDMFKGFSFKQ